MDKNKRLHTFIERLNMVDKADTADEAYTILAKVLNEVEDEFTNIPYSPHLWMTDGRLYPPQEDNRMNTSNTEVIRYRNRRHNTYFGNNGAIMIQELSGKIIVDKAGRDGRKVGEL